MNFLLHVEHVGDPALVSVLEDEKVHTVLKGEAYDAALCGITSFLPILDLCNALVVFGRLWSRMDRNLLLKMKLLVHARVIKDLDGPMRGIGEDIGQSYTLNPLPSPTRLLNGICNTCRSEPYYEDLGAGFILRHRLVVPLEAVAALSKALGDHSLFTLAVCSINKQFLECFSKAQQNKMAFGINKRKRKSVRSLRVGEDWRDVTFRGIG